MPRRGRGGGAVHRYYSRSWEPPPQSLRDSSPPLTTLSGQRNPPQRLQLPNRPPHPPYNPRMASFNPLHWRRTTLQGGLSERAAEDTATQLLDALADKGSRQELRDIVDTAFAKHDLRIIAALGAATTIIIAAMALLKLFG